MAVFRKTRRRCLAGLKSADDDFPASQSARPLRRGLGAAKTWNGVAIWRGTPIRIDKIRAAGDRDDREARYIEAASTASSSPASIFRTAIRSPGRNSTSSSLGSSGSSCTPRNFKAGYPRGAGRRLQRRPDRARYLSDSVVDKDALIQPKSRAAFKSLLAQGWCDAIREASSVEADVHVLDYKRNRWPRDAD